MNTARPQPAIKLHDLKVGTCGQIVRPENTGSAGASSPPQPAHFIGLTNDP